MNDEKPNRDIEVITDKRKRYSFYLDEAIELLYRKITKGKIKNPQNEKIKLDQLGKFGYLINIANSVYKDEQLDRIEQAQEELKKGILPTNTGEERVISSETLEKLQSLDDELAKIREAK